MQSMLLKKADDFAQFNYVGEAHFGTAAWKVGNFQMKKPIPITGRFNCDDPGHIAHNCPKPLTLSKDTARRLEYQQKNISVHFIHYVHVDLCLHLKGPGDSGVSESDPTIFQELATTNSCANFDSRTSKDLGSTATKAPEILSVSDFNLFKNILQIWGRV